MLPASPQRPQPPPPDWVALAGAAGTVALHFLLQARGPNRAFIAGACLFWLVFVCARAWRDRDAFHRWGFRLGNLRQAVPIPAALFALTAAGLALYGHLQGTLRWPPHLGLLLLVYPLWGVVQQFLVLGIVLNNLEQFPALHDRQALLGLLVAALFGLVHADTPWVAGGVFLLELVLIPLYLLHRNLWPLGVLHGWLGGLFYLWVLGRDLWTENFG